MQFTHDDVVRARDALDHFHAELGGYVNDSRILPQADSPFAVDLATFSAPEPIRTVYAQVLSLLEVAGDQLSAFLKTLREPCETIAPWVCVRGLVEASAISVWLLEPGVPPLDRVGRSKALRYEGLEQQRKWLGAIGQNQSLVKKQIDGMVEEARAMGYKVLKDSRDRRIGVATRMPSITELARDALGMEGMYRLLSAIAHGHHWALQQLSFRVLPTEETPREAEEFGFRAMQKEVNAPGMVFLSIGVADALGQTVWRLASYCGWDQDRLTETLERLFNGLGLADHKRFWR